MACVVFEKGRPNIKGRGLQQMPFGAKPVPA